MSVILIHLSDIHFGQEKGSLFYVHEDVRERLLDDVTVFTAALAPKRISGVMVTGDIAYSGTDEEYRQAGKWLDRLTAAIGCERSDVQVVPGNHDIDRGQISSAGSYLLKEVEEAGEAKLNVFLRDENDRELLYKRFHAYSEFSEAYNCPLDKNGGGAGDRLIELAPGRHIRMVGLNTALACSKNDVEGKLLLGERQRVLPRTSGEELVVLAHHPLKWMADAAEAAQYVRSRARVLVTGHEHNPSARVEKVFDGADLLTIEAGATVPPWSDEDYTYTFNFIEFGWNEAEDALAVNIHPRCWSNEKMEFEEDTTRLDPAATSVVLASPRFREAPKPVAAEGSALAEGSEAPVILQKASDGTIGMGDIPAEYSDIILRFFRDLTAAERLRFLVEVGAIPDNWDKPLSHGNERILFDRAIRDGKAHMMRDRLDELDGKDEDGGANG